MRGRRRRTAEPAAAAGPPPTPPAAWAAAPRHPPRHARVTAHPVSHPWAESRPSEVTAAWTIEPARRRRTDPCAWGSEPLNSATPPHPAPRLDARAQPLAGSAPGRPARPRPRAAHARPQPPPTHARERHPDPVVGRAPSHVPGVRAAADRQRRRADHHGGRSHRDALAPQQHACRCHARGRRRGARDARPGHLVRHLGTTAWRAPVRRAGVDRRRAAADAATTRGPRHGAPPETNPPQPQASSGVNPTGASAASTSNRHQADGGP